MGQQYDGVGNGSAVYMFEKTLHVFVNKMRGIHTGATGRRQLNHMSLELWVCCVIVAFRVNVKQRVQHKLLIQILTTFT
jgi:hypothetical protein